MNPIKGEKIWDATMITDRDESRIELVDMVRFKDHFYAGFREGMTHMPHPSGRGRIIRSKDGKKWETAVVLDWDGADVREPKLSVTSEGHLMANTALYFVSQHPRDVSGNSVKERELPPEERLGPTDPRGKYFQLESTGTPETDAEGQVARQSVTWLSSDGINWSSAYACPSGVNSWRWEVVWHNGMGYSVAYCGKDKAGTLHRTRDGKSWRVLKNNFFPDGVGSEATLGFDDDNAYSLLRHSGKRVMLGVGEAPYFQNWRWSELSVDCGTDHGGDQPAEQVLKADFGGPKLIRLKDGRFVAAARCLWPWRDDGKITLFWLDPAVARLTILAEIDGTTYGGIVEHEGEIWVACCGADWAENGLNAILAKVPISG